MVTFEEPPGGFTDGHGNVCNHDRRVYGPDYAVCWKCLSSWVRQGGSRFVLTEDAWEVLARRRYWQATREAERPGVAERILAYLSLLFIFTEE